MSPAGKVSVTVTTPAVGAVPSALFGVNVKLAFEPTVNVLVEVFVNARSGTNAANAVTVKVAVSHTEVFGAGAQTW